MIDPGDIQEGMTVRDVAGRKLGTVASVGDTHFELGQGSPAQRDFMVRLMHVQRIQGMEVFLAPGQSRVTPEDELPAKA